ncbi:TIGR00300 family protein [Methanotrichaceae archaeon M04Ac]|uniref:Ornithine cyclodeaminase n=1 Tax=Candidatus Methanocrinis alkalitolerans TaxID=3033395 RepID=A0ABT5XER2_9EURY|nr:TIGR00300 family protein [Candidatus Methanocrinis alkalitolerans]
MGETCNVEMEGHLIDSLTLTKALDKIMNMGGEFEIKKIQVGKKKHDTSYVMIAISGEDADHLDRILLALHPLGARVIEAEDVHLEEAPQNGVVPRGFYSTTNHLTHVRHHGAWLEVEDIQMDCLIIVKDDRAICVPIGQIEKGDMVVVGTGGVRVAPPQRPREKTFFEFMSNEVSSERPSGEIIKQLAEEICATKRAGGKIAVVGGPGIIHTGAGEALAGLIREGYIDALLAGNALAVHDIERQLFGTSLGMDPHGNLTSAGHRNHIYAISEVIASGSIREAVEDGKLKGGIMYECVKKNIPYVLAGSIRDDGPLPDVITDTVDAQKAMFEALRGVDMVIMMATMLHSIATGNLLPSRVKTICVDINPSTVTKLMDRGTAQAIGLVTDIGIFLPRLAEEVKRRTEAP